MENTARIAYSTTPTYIRIAIYTSVPVISQLANTTQLANTNKDTSKIAQSIGSTRTTARIYISMTREEGHGSKVVTTIERKW